MILLNLAATKGPKDFEFMSNKPKLSRFIWGTFRFDLIHTLRLNSICTESCLANRLLAWRIDNRGNDLCQFDRIDSNWQHFQPTLHSPPEVKIRIITIHEPSSFLKRGHKPQSIRTIRVDSIESSRIDNIFQFNPPYIVQGGYIRANRHPACRTDSRGNDSCRFDRIESNRQHFQPTLKAQISYIFETLENGSIIALNSTYSKGFK